MFPITGVPIVRLTHVTRYSYAGGLPLKLVYGREVGRENDSLIRTTEEAVLMLANVMFPGAVVVNAFPFRKSGPLSFIPVQPSFCVVWLKT